MESRGDSWWRRLSWPAIRDGLLLSVGLAGTVHETFFQAGERKVLLAVFAAMMGLSGALRLDQLRRVSSDSGRHRRRNSEDE